METIIKVGAVNYLNTKPLIWGFEKGLMAQQVELRLNNPASIAEDLLHNRIDIGLVPVAVLPCMTQYYIISDYCIGSLNNVASVCLFSNVPLEQIKYIYLDYQSRTSVALLRILLSKYWQVSVAFLETMPGYETKIRGTTAALIIGDRALAFRKDFSHIYDLGQAWRDFTGLPFIYAAWVANRKLSVNFLNAFNTATSEGLKHLLEIVKDNPFESYDLMTYFTKNIDYKFDVGKKAALELFLDYLDSDRIIAV